MQFASYADFRSKVLTLLDGDDISKSDLSVDTLDIIIAMGERRIYRELRSTTQETATTLAISSGVATLPADFLEFKGAPSVSGFVEAIYAPYEALQNAIALGQRTDAKVVFWTTSGNTALFYPTNSSTANILYFKKFADISTGLNALFNRHPDIFLYAALAESAPFLGEVARLQVWEQKYQGLVEAANEEERRRSTRGGKLQTRVA